MKVGGEIIQLSFGPASNAVTSHLCNLQGLACTGTSDDINEQSSDKVPLCDPYITHAVHRETYVPRVLFVDGRNCFNPWPDPSSNPSSSGNGDPSGGSSQSGAWKGNVEVHHRRSDGANSNVGNTSTNMSFNSNEYGFEPNNVYAEKSTNANEHWNQLSSNQRDAFSQFQNVASINTGFSLSSNPHSRYHSSRYSQVSSQFVYPQTLASSDGRVMNWDEDEEEEDESEEMYEDEFMRGRRIQLEQQKREREEDLMEQQLHHAWDTFVGTDADADANAKKEAGNASSSSPAAGNVSAAADTEEEDDRIKAQARAAGKRKMALDSLQWMNYFMPPHPNPNTYTAALPFDREYIVQTQIQSNTRSQMQQQKSSQVQSMIHSFRCGKYATTSSSSFCGSTDMNEGMTTEWRDNVLSEKIRKWMEDCDSVRGFQVAVDCDMEFFAGLASSVLEELGDECRSAGKFSIMVGDGKSFVAGCENGDGSGDGSDGENGRLSYWRSENKAVQDFRKGLNSGLGLHGISENSDLVLPLSLSNCWKSLHKKDEGINLFEASAAGALALETATLPYRLASRRGSGLRKRSKIGIASGYFQGSSQLDDDAFPSADTLSYHEFLSSMKPSNRHIMTELSGLLHPLSPAKVHQALLQGTSIERRQLEEERNRNKNSYYRRSRLRDVDPGLWMEDEGPNGGIVSSLSPVGSSAASSRGLHNHYALASSLRSLPSRMGDVISTYTASLMEGMYIRYRPQCSVATVVDQTFHALTGPRSNSAGSYWGNIMGQNAVQTQTFTVLGNSTRIHSHLQTTATGLKSALSRKYAGYLTRDGLSGLAPEGEDCADAMEACLSMRDVYEPPSMAFDSDEEGGYFEDNTD